MSVPMFQNRYMLPNTNDTRCWPSCLRFPTTNYQLVRMTRVLYEVIVYLRRTFTWWFCGTWCDCFVPGAAFAVHSAAPKSGMDDIKRKTGFANFGTIARCIPLHLQHIECIPWRCIFSAKIHSAGASLIEDIIGTLYLVTRKKRTPSSGNNYNGGHQNGVSGNSYNSRDCSLYASLGE